MSKKLVLTLNVAEDDDLRNYIKDLVKGQVKSIVRQEFYTMVSEIISEKVGTSVKYIDVNEETLKMVREEIRRQLPAGKWQNPDIVKEIAREEIKLLLKERLGGLKIVDNI